MFSQILSELRKQKKLTQNEMAKILGIARTTYSSYEQGRRMPDTDLQNTIADYFGVSLDYLHGRAEKQNASKQKKTVTVESALDSIMTSDGKKLSEDDKRVAADIIKRLLEDGK